MLRGVRAVLCTMMGASAAADACLRTCQTCDMAVHSRMADVSASPGWLLAVGHSRKAGAGLLSTVPRAQGLGVCRV